MVGIKMVDGVGMLVPEMSPVEVRGKVSNKNNQTEGIEPEVWRDYWRRQRTMGYSGILVKTGY